MGKIDELLAEEGSAAEDYQVPDPIPSGVQVDRPNLGRSVVVSVRLSADEHAEVQRAADRAKLPVSTLIRLWALDRLQAEHVGGTVAQRLERLERHVFRDTA